MDNITRHDNGRCAVLMLNRPEALNTLNASLLDDLQAHLDQIAADASRALILVGQGRVFCAGADLKEQSVDPERRMARMHGLIERLAQFPKISVAAINGLAFGGGLELAMACTFRVAAPQARFGMPEIKLGLMPVYGGTQLLPRLIGERRALQMMLSGEPIDVDQALAYGLIDRLAIGRDALLDDACELAMACGQHGLLAQQAIRRAVRDGIGLDLSEGLLLERTLGAQLATTADAREGVNAFIEQRPAVFTDC